MLLWLRKTLWHCFLFLCLLGGVLFLERQGKRRHRSTCAQLGLAMEEEEEPLLWSLLKRVSQYPATYFSEAKRAPDSPYGRDNLPLPRLQSQNPGPPN